MAIVRDQRDCRIVRLAVAALGTLAVEPIYVLVDTAIVGRLGTEPLAALGVAGIVILSVVALISFVEYITADIAFAHGADHADQARRAATNALWIGFGLGVVGGAVMAIGAPVFCRALGAKGAVFDGAVLYTRISAVAVPFSQLVFVGHGVMRGVNQLRKPLVIVVVANIVNVITELIAVFVLDLGIAGSAWSTVLVIIGSAAAFMWLLRPHLARTLPDRDEVAKQLRSGLHLTIRVLGMLIIWVTATAIAARVDTPTLAAQNICNQLFMFLALAVDSFAIPAQSLVAGALGEGSPDEAMSIGWACLRLSLWAGGAIAFVLIAASWLIPHAFTADDRVISRATAGLILLGLIQIPGAVAFALDGALIGGKDEAFLGRQAWWNLLGFLPLAIATFIWPSWGIIGLWGAQLTWMTTRAVVNTLRFRSRRWIGPVATA